MSSSSGAVGPNCSQFAYKSSDKKGGAAAMSPQEGAGSRRKKPRRKIVHESDDDDDEDDVLTSPEAKQRMIPRKGGRANGTAGGASGVSAVDVRDSPAPNGGGGVAASPESDDGTSSGSEDVCWFKKPSKGGGGGGGRVGGAVGKSTVKVERAKAMANPGWMSKNDPSTLTEAERRKNVQRAKEQRRTAGGGKASRRSNGGKGTAGKPKTRALGRRRSSRLSSAADDEEEEEEEEESEESCSTGDDSEEEEEREFEDEGESSEGGSEDDPELTDASEGDDADATTNATSMESAAPKQRSAEGSGSWVGTRGSKEGGRGSPIPVANGRRTVQNGFASGRAGVAAVGNGVKKGGGHGGGAGGVPTAMEVEDVELVGVKEGGGSSDGGKSEQAPQKKKRRLVSVSDDESSDGSEGEARRKEEPVKRKKKKVMKLRQDDDMDDSDRGSGSEDDGARAKKVLAECSKLSKKLASVISSWAASTEDGSNGSGAGTDHGALEITHLKDGGRAVTTNEEIEEACPGLKLNPYQLVGVNWMSLLRETGVNGVLADEMGLGKTVQTIAFFALLRHRREGAPPRRPHLVVVPSSVLDNWDSELKKFCPALKVVKYHGHQKSRAAMRQSLNRVASGANREDMPDIILTTYVIWERESSGDDRTFLKRFKYDYMVLDEGHSIKNIKSSRFQRLRVVVSRHRLLLSGTPVQNNLGELLALLSFLMPEIFRSDVIETLLEFLGEGDSSSLPTASAFPSFQVREVRGMLAPFVLRRLKSGVLKQLVAKTEKLEKVPLSKVQKSLYDGVLEEHVRQKRAALGRSLAIEKRAGGCAAGSVDCSNGNTNVTRSSVGAAGGAAVDLDGDGESLEKAGVSAKEIKNVFTELRKGANHPLMLLHHFKGGGKVEEVVAVLHRTGYFGGQATKEMVAKEVANYSDFDLHQICSGFDSLSHLCLPEEVLFTSAKMERLRTLLPDLVAKGHRILLFSQWTRLLDLLEVLLQDSMGFKFCRLDGSTPVSERKALIDQFGSDLSIPVFLLSTRAGGLGINLTSADTVILHDVDFNPENDRQAEDRCHRIGQTKPVTVIKMVAAGTVDEDIYSMGERKKEVNKSVLNDAASKDKDAVSTISGILKRAIQVHLESTR